MPLAAGDVVFAFFPYPEEEPDQEHPCVVLVPDLPANYALCCMVTTKKQRFDTCVELTPEDFQDGGMERWPSYARPYRIATISNDILRRKLGQLRQESFEKIRGPILRRLNNA